jgi:hypothetical protein
MVCEESEHGAGLFPSLSGEEEVYCQIAPPNATLSCINSDGTPLTTEETMAIFLPKQNSSTPVEVEVEVNPLDDGSGWQLDFAGGSSCTIEDETQK